MNQRRHHLKTLLQSAHVWVIRRGRHVIPGLLGGLLLLNILLGWYWSREPALPELALSAESVTGEATTMALADVMTMLLEKRGGYLSNDILPHRLWLDNMPNWEYGVLTQGRDMARALHRDIGRAPGREDGDLAIASPQFNFDHKSWAMPSTEGEYRRGIRALERYLARLQDLEDGTAHFNDGPANLDYWLGEVQERLTELSRRLSNSVGRPLPDAGLLERDDAPLNRTPWREVDNVFYQARGSSWALLHLLRGVEIDFGPSLTPEGRIHLRRVMHQLEYTQAPIRSPLILNGSGFGVFANHSLVMANHIAGANMSLRELRDTLAW